MSRSQGDGDVRQSIQIQQNQRAQSPRPRNAILSNIPSTSFGTSPNLHRRPSAQSTGKDSVSTDDNTSSSHSPAPGKMFPRSLTTGDSSPFQHPNRSHARNRPVASGGNPRAISYHPGAIDSSSRDNSSSYAQLFNDVERQSNATNNSDVALQGRSYRFQQSDVHHAPLVSPYTATSNTIRDSTAFLAGMALRSDEDSDSQGRMEDAIEEGSDEDASPPLTIRVTPTAQSPTSKVATVGEDAVHEGENEATEATPLISSHVRSKRGRSQQSSTDGYESNRSKSQSRSKSPAPQSITEGEGQSGFSIFSNRSGGQGAAKNSSSTYGYGALAQASNAARGQPTSAGGRDHHVSFAESNYYYDDEGDDELDAPLPIAWAFVPPFLRPKNRPSPSLSGYIKEGFSGIGKLTWKEVISASAEPVRLLPAVFLGILLNVLDGVSYGLIIFPTSYPMFSDFGGDGVSMFFVTCVISQLIYTLGGSIFKGGNGSMMIEVVPFYHILVKIIIDTLGETEPAAVISTTMIAFALSSIFAGIVFLALGYFRLGVLIGFFPRHILVGCIGGVGVFLIETGLEVAGQLKSEEGFQWNLETLRFFVQSWEMVAHWVPPLLLAILLRLITAKFHHPLVFPTYFLVIPILFYIIASGILRVPLEELRKEDWIFDVGKAAEAPFWRFYTYFDFRKTSWEALWATMPTQLALTFFSILHVPLNVPALAVSVNEDNLDTDRELFAHGISNIAAGLAGSVPNYLCYVNSVLFYRVGGGSRLSGLMLAAGTFIIFLSGPGAIGYLPIMVVGALIFVLGIDLTKEAVWDTIGRVNAWEYFTIWVIIFVMTYYDFVVGILAGVIVACLFFVIQTSRRRTVRAVLDGSIARSTVRRHTTQRQFLDQAGQQTQIVKLQGFLYFANISGVEELIRKGLDIATWQEHPIRFLIVDFSLVYGVDFSAAEAFTRIQRLLQAKDVVLTFCGVTPDSDVGIALRSVDLWTDSAMRLEVFQNLNEALEWTENEYLRSMYMAGASAGKPLVQSARAALDVPSSSKRAPAFNLNETSENSPRRQHLFEAAHEAASKASNPHLIAKLADSPSSSNDSTANRRRSHSNAVPEKSSSTEQRRLSHSGIRPTHGSGLPPAAQPFTLLMITFQAWAREQHDDDFYRSLAPYFREQRLLKGEVLWQRGDPSDGLYLIESGILKARYDFPQEDYEINEAMLAGTIAGELTFLSKASRNTTAYAEMDCCLWKLDSERLQQLRKDRHDVFDNLLQLLLCACSEEQEGLMSYLVSRLS
ncbi:hypothetical protein L7F22_054033 [Adiantum nelumboides]|nr:hypothetical protein [Adiantum nelumboides]